MDKIVNSIIDLFQYEDENYIHLNLIPHITKNFNVILTDTELLKVLNKLSNLGYTIAMQQDNSIIDLDIKDLSEEFILNIIYSGDLIIKG